MVDVTRRPRALAGKRGVVAWLLVGVCLLVGLTIFVSNLLRPDPRLAILDELDVRSSSVVEVQRSTLFGDDGYGAVRVLSVSEEIKPADLVLPPGWRLVAGSGNRSPCDPSRNDVLPECLTSRLAVLKMTHAASDDSIGDEIEVVQTGPVRTGGVKDRRWEIRIYFGL